MKKSPTVYTKQKAKSALISPDKHKPLPLGRRFFAFLMGVAYDRGKKGSIFSLEGLGAGAGLYRGDFIYGRE
jgi:hypothetical protein